MESIFKVISPTEYSQLIKELMMHSEILSILYAEST